MGVNSFYQTRKLHLRQREPHEIINKAVDSFLTSLGDDLKEKAVGIILSGSGCDGAHGLKHIHKCGGIGMVQEPASAEFEDMPEAAIRIDHPTHILGPNQLAKKLVKLVVANEN